jgi:hypothetical protein
MNIQQVAKKLEIHPRTLQQVCKRLEVPKKGTSYTISKEDFKRIKHEVTDPNKLNSKFVNLITETFTPEDYEKFRTRLIEWNSLQDRIGDLKNEIDYLRKSLDKHNEQMNLILASIRERNAIDYKQSTNNDR